MEAHEAGGGAVRSDAVEIAPERRLLEEVPHAERHGGEDVHGPRDPEPFTPARSVSVLEIPMMIDWLSVYQVTTPATTAAVPRVAISEFTPIPRRAPVAVPTAAPTATASTTATTAAHRASP